MMKSLEARLQRLIPTVNRAPKTLNDDLLALLERVLPKPGSRGADSGPITIDHLYRAPKPVTVLDDLTLTKTPHGDISTIHKVYPLDAVHGANTLSGALSGVDWAFWLNDERFNQFTIKDALFFDLETTGLSHGVGTMAFVVGLGRFVGCHFHVYQYFLDDPGAEQAMLHEINRHLEQCPHLVSFNGRSFDSHILHNRQALQRMPATVELIGDQRLHLDLLHLSRRLFKGVFENVKLQTIERDVLKFHRVDDVPSAVIPTLYFQFLQHQEIAAMAPIIEHNHFDILSMVTLVGSIASMLENPIHGPVRCAVNISRWLVKIKAFGPALTLLDDAICRCGEGDAPRLFRVAVEACISLRDHNRLERWLALWTEACPDDGYAWQRLSMHLEHRIKDYVGALRCARLAVELSDSSRVDDLRHRIRRLERRSDSKNASKMSTA